MKLRSDIYLIILSFFCYSCCNCIEDECKRPCNCLPISRPNYKPCKPEGNRIAKKDEVLFKSYYKGTVYMYYQITGTAIDSTKFIDDQKSFVFDQIGDPLLVPNGKLAFIIFTNKAIPNVYGTKILFSDEVKPHIIEKLWALPGNSDLINPTCVWKIDVTENRCLDL